MSEQSNTFMKILYFDEGSAIDYLSICNGGALVQEDSHSVKTGSKALGSTGASVSSGILFKALKPLIDFDIKAEGKANLSRIGESVVKSSITNTVLTDFLSASEPDNRISKFKNINVLPPENSVSFIKMYTPLMKMFNFDIIPALPIKFSAMDETFEESKGYYEMLTTYDGNTLILRFNIQSFKNNYKLIDLTRVNLSIYCIEVGKMNIDKLNVNNEFNFSDKVDNITSSIIIDGPKKADNDKSVYDVILAGIQANE